MMRVTEYVSGVPIWELLVVRARWNW